MWVQIHCRLNLFPYLCPERSFYVWVSVLVLGRVGVCGTLPSSNLMRTFQKAPWDFMRALPPYYVDDNTKVMSLWYLHPEVQPEKNDLALEGQPLFFATSSIPKSHRLQTDINWLLPHLQTRGRRQATFVPQSNTQLPLAKWLHSSFWEFLLDFVWLTTCAMAL